MIIIEKAVVGTSNIKETEELILVRLKIQGYLAHKKTPTP